jgi:hypothetical protein
MYANAQCINDMNATLIIKCTKNCKIKFTDSEQSCIPLFFHDKGQQNKIIRVGFISKVITINEMYFKQDKLLQNTLIHQRHVNHPEAHGYHVSKILYRKPKPTEVVPISYHFFLLYIIKITRIRQQTSNRSKIV